MFYDFAIKIPKGTKEVAPVEQEFNLTHGIIHRVEVEFYPGPRRYVWVKIFHHEHQLWPTNLDGSFQTDAYTIAFDEYEELLEAPYNLLVRGYSPEADYDHVVTVRIGILESKTVILLLNALKGLMKLSKLMGIKV
ncbi:hypothetical protein ES707_15420 [subsurface metagenome]